MNLYTPKGEVGVLGSKGGLAEATHSYILQIADEIVQNNVYKNVQKKKLYLQSDNLISDQQNYAWAMSVRHALVHCPEPCPMGEGGLKTELNK